MIAPPADITSTRQHCRYQSVLIGCGSQDNTPAEVHRTGRSPKNLPPEHRTVLRRKLAALDQSRILNELRIPPTNHLEKPTFGLSAYFGNSAEFWLGLRDPHDLSGARATIDVAVIPKITVTYG